MSSMKSFVISNKDDKENFDEADNLAFTLDSIDFAIDGYLVDSKRYPQIGKALLGRKGKASLVDDDEKDVKDIGGVGSTPSLSTANLNFEDSIDNVVYLEDGNVSHSNVDDDFARPNQNLDVLDFDHLNILERPSSAPAGRSGSSGKRRRVASADARSLLGRPRFDEDRLCHLEEKIEE